MKQTENEYTEALIEQYDKLTHKFIESKYLAINDVTNTIEAFKNAGFYDGHTILEYYKKVLTILNSKL